MAMCIKLSQTLSPLINRWFLIALVFTGVIIWGNQQIVFNPTISIPRGYYFTYSSVNYTVNDLVLLCVMDAQQLAIMHKLHLPYVEGSCPDDAPYLMKYIVAGANDTVEINASGVWINGALQQNSMAFNTYKEIKLLPLPYSKFRLKTDEYFVLGASLHSFDSRYFGIVRKEQIYRKARLLFLSKHLIW